MLLALDIGNTNIVVGVFDAVDLVAQWRLSTQRERTADELASFVQIAFNAHGFSFDDVHGVAISSVVPSLTPQAAQMSRVYFKCDPLVVGHDTDTGLINDYENPREVGADRLVNGLAAWTKYQTSVVIVDFGTATTVDAVSYDRHYLGGAIAPGLQISTDALFRAAARLPRVELVAPRHAMGKNTVESLQAGILFGYSGLVKELVERCTYEVSRFDSTEPGSGNGGGGHGRVRTVATGGLAELIAPLVPAIEHVEPELTLHGLRLVWEKNRLCS